MSYRQTARLIGLALAVALVLPLAVLRFTTPPFQTLRAGARQIQPHGDFGRYLSEPDAAIGPGPTDQQANYWVCIDSGNTDTCYPIVIDEPGY